MAALHHVGKVGAWLIPPRAGWVIVFSAVGHGRFVALFFKQRAKAIVFRCAIHRVLNNKNLIVLPSPVPRGMKIKCKMKKISDFSVFFQKIPLPEEMEKRFLNPTAVSILESGASTS